MSGPALILPRDDGGWDIGRWALAAAIVLAGYCGLAAGVLLLPPVEPQGAPIAPAIIVDLAPLPVAPASPVDLAPGPEMIESQPAPAPPPPPVPQMAEPIQKIEAPAEVTLPPPEPRAKPVEEKPLAKPAEPKPETLHVEQAPPAPRTTAAPRAEHRTAPAPQAPSAGRAASRAAIATWRDRVVARLQQSKRYPRAAEARREQGVVTLSFTVDRNGRVLSRSILRSSGHASLDQEVLAMALRAQPLPPFPAAMPQASIMLTVPIRFSLR